MIGFGLAKGISWANNKIASWAQGKQGGAAQPDSVEVSAKQGEGGDDSGLHKNVENSSTDIEITEKMVDTLNSVEQHQETLENTTRLLRSEDGSLYADQVTVQGDLNEKTGVITSAIKNDKSTVAFGHDHPGNSEHGIGPLDRQATKLTGKPSYIKTRNKDIYLIEGVKQRKNGTWKTKKLRCMITVTTISKLVAFSFAFLALYSCQSSYDWHRYYQENINVGQKIYLLDELSQFSNDVKPSQLFFGYIRIGWDGYHNNCLISDKKSIESSLYYLSLEGTFCKELDINGYGLIQGVYGKFEDEIYSGGVLYSGKISNISSLVVEDRKFIPE